MSRNRTKRRHVVEVARPQEQRRQPNIRPGGTNFTPVTNDLLMSSMYQALSPQAPQTSTPLFPPGAPLRPIPGLTPPEGPRGWQFPVSVNTGRLPRSTEQYSFGDLRALAASYYGFNMCQQVWLDYISKLELTIEPLPGLIGDDEDSSKYDDDIAPYLDFFAYPDQEHDLHSWLGLMVKDQLEIDAVALFPHKDRAGRLLSLDVLDGALIAPLVDDRGRRPIPPYPAYEQYWAGLPACLLTSDDLIYIKETERTDSVYGRSRVEKVIINVNIALRKLTMDLARFTDGTVPRGFITPSMDVNWSQEEIQAWEMQLNNLMAGNDELRARLKVLPRGFTYEGTEDEDIHVDLDKFILNICAAAHGLTMDELAMTENSNRSVGQSQENVVYRRAMGPLIARYERLMTHILRKYFNEKRFRIRLKGYEEVSDFNEQATGLTTLTTNGVLGITDAAKIMKLPLPPDAPYVGRIIVTKSGPIFLDDIATPEARKAAMDAQMAGLELASHPQQQGQDEDEEEPEDTANSKGVNDKPTSGKQTNNAVSSPSKSSTSTQKGKNGTQDERAANADTLYQWQQGSCTCEECRQNAGQVRVPGQAYPSGAMDVGTHAGCDCQRVPVTPERAQDATMQRLLAQVEAILQRLPALPEEKPETPMQAASEREVLQEINRWKDRAVEDMKRNRAFRGFTSTILPESLHTRIESALLECQSIADVREVFARAKAAKSKSEDGGLATQIAALFEDVEQRGRKELTA